MRACRPPLHCSAVTSRCQHRDLLNTYLSVCVWTRLMATCDASFWCGEVDAYFWCAAGAGVYANLMSCLDVMSPCHVMS